MTETERQILENDHQIDQEMERRRMETPPNQETPAIETIMPPILDPAIVKVEPVDLPKVTKSKLEQHFHPNFVALMEAAPQNKLVLGKMMATLGVMPPQELVTFSELRNWVEMTFDEPTKKKAVPSVRAQRYFDVEMRGSRDVSGTCRFSQTEEARESVSFSLEDIREQIEDGKTMDALSDWVETAARDEGDLSWEGDDHIEYSDYDASNYENEVVSRAISYDQFERQLRDFLQAEDPELLETLDSN